LPTVGARRRHRLDRANLSTWLARREPQRVWPAASTVGEILARHGLIPRGGDRRRGPAYSQPFVQPIDHALWVCYFKGQWRLGNGTWCYPLTVSDSYSAACCVSRADQHARAPRAGVDGAAVPRARLAAGIRTDNGSPFASVGLGGLSRLSVWWVRLGIWPERIAPGHPEQNGRHERLHRTLRQPPWCRSPTIWPRSSAASSASAPSTTRERSHQPWAAHPGEVYSARVGLIRGGCHRWSIRTTTRCAACIGPAISAGAALALRERSAGRRGGRTEQIDEACWRL